MVRTFKRGFAVGALISFFVTAALFSSVWYVSSLPPTVHVNVLVQPRIAFTNYSVPISGSINEYDATQAQENLFTGAPGFTTGFTSDGTNYIVVNGNWVIGHEYAFSIHSGSYSDSFSYTLHTTQCVWSVDANCFPIETAHFTITFNVWI